MALVQFNLAGTGTSVDGYDSAPGGGGGVAALQGVGLLTMIMITC
jgi:hypothetical protein